MTPLFRWDGSYWGFLVAGQLYDRYGRHLGWLAGHDVYHRGGRFLGELTDAHHVLRHRLRAEPIHQAPRPAVDWATPPLPPPDRDPRDPRDDWSDALPWPLPPPEPPVL